MFFFFLCFKGSSQIEIIYLEFPSSEEEVIKWKGDELKKMQNLKTLIVKNGSFSNGPKYLPNSLRVLEWHKYPSRVIPSDFCPKKLSICKLQQSDFISFGLHGTMKVCVIFPRPLGYSSPDIKLCKIFAKKIIGEDYKVKINKCI